MCSPLQYAHSGIAGRVAAVPSPEVGVCAIGETITPLTVPSKSLAGFYFRGGELDEPPDGATGAGGFVASIIFGSVHAPS